MTMRDSPLRPTAALLIAVLALMVLPTSVAGAGQGVGNPKLSTSVQVVQASKVTDVTVTGVDYLVPPHAPGTDVFGGVYVFFGWVSDPVAFGPSTRNSQNNNGVMGVSFVYPGDGADPGTRDPGTGTMRMVSFTTGGESGNATAFHMDRDGNWTTKLRIYSSVFSTELPSGEVRTIDCLNLKSGQCGVFTIGAHGKSSATNEKFVPIRFTGTSPSSPPPAASVSPGGGSKKPAATGGGPVSTQTPAESSAGDAGTAGNGLTSSAGAVSPESGGTAGSGSGPARSGDSSEGVDDAVALGDVGSRRSDAAEGATRGAGSSDSSLETEVIAASVKSVSSDGASVPALVLGAVLLGVVAGAVVVVRRRRSAEVAS